MAYRLGFWLSIFCHILGVQSATNTTQKITWKACPDINQIIKNSTSVPGEQISLSPFDCANIVVPLDYTEPNSQDLSLDLFKVNATQTPVLGSVLINFGGPGGTGVENLAEAAGVFAELIGYQWNLVSWNPRGTGKTIPFNCNINSTLLSGSTPSKRATTPISSNLTEMFLKDGWDNAGLVADACYKTMNDTGRFISTTSTARDVIAIVDALGEDGMLRYWGWSYGTALGSYIAALYPERVERMVLDGNLNPNNYQSGTYGYAAMDDEKAFQGFLQECLNNKDQCSLAQYTKATTTDDMVIAINKYQQPLLANVTDYSSYQTNNILYSTIFKDLYSPASWPTLADEIVSALNGTGLPKTPAPVDTYDLGQPLSILGIRGADATWQPATREDYLPQVQYQNSFGAWALLYVTLWISARWKITPKDRYYGNFNATTKHPILYVNGEFDPITPIRGAYDASQGFKGSVVLAHNGYGHGVPMDFSQCVADYTKDYFVTGALPPIGKTCNPDKTPWEAAGLGKSSGSSNGTQGTNSSIPGTIPTGSGSKQYINIPLLFTLILILGF